VGVLNVAGLVVVSMVVMEALVMFGTVVVLSLGLGRKVLIVVGSVVTGLIVVMVELTVAVGRKVLLVVGSLVIGLFVGTVLFVGTG